MSILLSLVLARHGYTIKYYVGHVHALASTNRHHNQLRISCRTQPAGSRAFCSGTQLSHSLERSYSCVDDVVRAPGTQRFMTVLAPALDSRAMQSFSQSGHPPSAYKTRQRVSIRVRPRGAADNKSVCKPNRIVPYTLRTYLFCRARAPHRAKQHTHSSVALAFYKADVYL